MIKNSIIKLIKEIQYISPLRRYFFPLYVYNFSPPQLCFICQCLEETKDIPGNIAEIGCSAGATTVFLNKYLDAQGIEKKYFAVDTFSGFSKEDIQLEVSKRGKRKGLFTGFQANKNKWFDGTMKINNINRVKSIQADVNKYDLCSLGPLSFCLLDVDLYQPTKKSLGQLYTIMSKGGTIIIDDCNPNHIQWDGAYQAYNEFMKEIQQPARVVYGKLGIIKKSA